MIYFTSDLHFDHANIIKHCYRPFETVEAMNEALIMNWNSAVGLNDTVYILGDILMSKDPEIAKKFMGRLTGKKILIQGNHDYFVKKYLAGGYDFLTDIKVYDELNYNRERFVLMHYPIMDWNNMYHGSYMLHGHMHNKALYNYDNKLKGIRRYDVGVDANNFKPISIDSIIRYFK